MTSTKINVGVDVPLLFDFTAIMQAIDKVSLYLPKKNLNIEEDIGAALVFHFHSDLFIDTACVECRQLAWNIITISGLTKPDRTPVITEARDKINCTLELSIQKLRVPELKMLEHIIHTLARNNCWELSKHKLSKFRFSRKHPTLLRMIA